MLCLIAVGPECLLTMLQGVARRAVDSTGPQWILSQASSNDGSRRASICIRQIASGWTLVPLLCPSETATARPSCKHSPYSMLSHGAACRDPPFPALRHLFLRLDP